MMKSLIPLLVFASAVAGAVDIQKRILNGKDCGDDEGQHYVVLRNRNTKEKFCGGNLISERWILTAMHCDEPEFEVVLGKHPHGVGKTMQISPNDERHFFEANNHRHDIMLLKLPQNPPKGLPIIPLPKTGCRSPPVLPDNPYTIMGWSFTAFDNNGRYHNLPSKLQCGKVYLHPDCTGRNLNVAIDPPEAHQYIREHMLCSINPNGVQACKSCPGDSGGSLVKRGILYGVTVASSVPAEGRTHYMDVCAYRDWIHKRTGI